ncbi:MAG: hypothetical protein WC220_06930 [Pedobacter sp.]|jgi:hypothetical protein
MARIWAFVNGSSKASVAAATEIACPLMPVIFTPAWLSSSSPS